MLGAGAVERRGPDPQGADVRPHQQRGQPRRGRQGVLVLPRQHAHALVPEVPVQVPAARVPVRGPRRTTNGRRGKQDSEYELLDTGIFDEDRYFDVVVEYAKAAPDDILMLVTAHNRGPDAATLHLLPTLWFRNTWSWGGDVAEALDRPARRRDRHPELGEWRSSSRRRSSCSARTRPARKVGDQRPPASHGARRGQPRDGHQVRRAPRARDPRRRARATIRLRLTARDRRPVDFDARVRRSPRGGRRVLRRRSSRRRSTTTGSS